MSIGGIFKSLINPTNLAMLAMGPGGWAAMASKMLISTAMNTVIDQLGAKLNLPQGVTDFAKQAFNAQMGFTPTQSLGDLIDTLGDQVGATATERGQLSSQMDFFMDRVNQKLEKAIEEAGNEKNGVRNPKGAKSFLMRLAEVMGAVLDDKMQAMIDKGGEIDKESGKEKPKLGTLSAEMTALGKELDFVSQALNNALKSIGDAGSTLARKQ